MSTETDFPPVNPKIMTVIQRTVEEHFEGKDLVAVQVDPDEDHIDRQAVCTVRVIVDNTSDVEDLGRRKLGDLIVLLRRALVKEGDSTFPVVRMMTKRDAKPLGREIH